MTNDVKETWRKVHGYPDYCVSDKGNVRRVTPDLLGRLSGKNLKPGIGSNGYRRVVLCLDGGKQNLSIHRLVCIAWHGLPENDDLHAAHWDGDKANNIPSNLRWATAQENIDDIGRHGRRATGERNGSRLYPERLARGEAHYSRTKPECVPRGDRSGRHTKPERTARGERSATSKLTECAVREIRGTPRAYGSNKMLAEKFGVYVSAIEKVIARTTWRHVA